MTVYSILNFTFLDPDTIDIFGIPDPDPHRNLGRSETLVESEAFFIEFTLNRFNAFTPP